MAEKHCCLLEIASMESPAAHFELEPPHVELEAAHCQLELHLLAAGAGHQEATKTTI